MKTQDLIGLLANDTLQTHLPAQRQLTRSMLVGGLVCAVLLVSLWGVNPELNAMASRPVFIVKMLWLLCLMGFSVYGLLRLSRPGMKAGHTWTGLGLSGLTMLSLGLVQSWQVDAGERAAQWMGTSWQVCSASIAALSLPILGALLWALHQLAPTRPALCGAVAGVLAGSLAASIYSLHCTETSFAFFSAWYVASMAAVSLLGAALGPRCLRW